MPRTRSLAFAELKLGIIAVVALVLAGLLIFAVGGGGFFWQQYPLKTTFANVAGVKSGSPVRIAGIEKGSVTRVELTESGVELWFTVEKDVRNLITNQSFASIGSISLLGEGAVDITAAPAGTPVPDWGYVPSRPATGSIAELTEAATGGLNEAKLLVQDIRAGQGTVGKLFTDDAVYREIQQFVSAAEQVTSAIARGEGTLGRLTRDPKLYRELEQSIANLNAMTTKMRAGEGSIGQMLNDPALARNLTNTTANLESITGRVDKGEGTLGRLISDDALYTRLDELINRLDGLAKGLGSGQGTAGQLLQDQQLYENMNQAAHELRGLIGDIRKDPKKYLNVKVSIF
jgi:phospholipid/cholesterol/gamma-HCH transport system substrate-binding protein